MPKKTGARLEREIAEALTSPSHSGSGARAALRLLKNAVQYLYDSDFELVEGGCADVSEILAAFARKKGFAVEVVYGEAIVGNKIYHHAWLRFHGKRFDPTWWVQHLRGETYREDPRIRQGSICALIEGDDLDDYVIELERNVHV